MPEESGRVSRRSFLRISLMGSAGLFLGAGATAAYSLAIAPYRPEVERLEIALLGFPSGSPPFTIAQLSDFHIGDRISAGDIRRAVEMVNALKPDLAVLTGDFAYHDPYLVQDAAMELSRLRAPLGLYAVLGNHDYWTDPVVVSEALGRNGIDLLVNAATRLEHDGGLWLAGIDDIWSGAPDLDRTLKPIPEGAPAILLCHEPDFADRVPARVGLQLSGHTHGGQVRLPGLGARVLPAYGWKYQIGLCKAAETLVYVNRGIGVIDPPIRFNCPPEITLITLRCA